MNNNKIWIILKDGLILFGVSTVLVVLADVGFSGLKKKVPKDDPVVAAIFQGELKGVEEALTAAKKKDSDKAMLATDEHGRTSLMRTAYLNLTNDEELKKQDEKRAGMTTLLLDQGSLIDAKDKDGWTPLMWAAWSGTTKVAAVLLERGATTEAADRQGNTALMIAAQRGNTGCVRSMLEKGAKKEAATPAGITALDMAKSGKTDYPGREACYKEVISLLGGS